MSIVGGIIFFVMGTSLLRGKGDRWVFGSTVMGDTEKAERDAKYDMPALRRFHGWLTICAGFLFFAVAGLNILGFSALGATIQLLAAVAYIAAAAYAKKSGYLRNKGLNE